MSIRDDLIAARALIADPAKWGQGPDGLTPPEHGQCAMNACAYQAGSAGAEQAMVLALFKELPPGPWLEEDLPVATFNDAATTTHADIMALFDRAIEAAS